MLLAAWSFIRKWLGRRNDSAARAAASTSDRLVADIEAFLAGNYVAALLDRGDLVPGWGWLNKLAHGDFCGVRQLRSPSVLRGRRSSSPEEGWRAAQRLLAKDLLEVTRCDPSALYYVQQTVLVPLELELIDKESREGLSALELVWSTRAALHADIW